MRGDLYFAGPVAQLTIAFDGGHIRAPNTKLIGGRVWGFVLHWTRRGPGVFDCL